MSQKGSFLKNPFLLLKKMIFSINLSIFYRIVFYNIQTKQFGIGKIFNFAMLLFSRYL